MNGMKPPSEGTGIPPMMKQMMDKMCGGGECGPAAMCQGMASTGKTAQTDMYASPEVRKVFEEWARSAEDEILAALKARGPLDLATLAGALRISPEGAFHLLGKLVREGKATIGPIRATGGADATN